MSIKKLSIHHDTLAYISFIQNNCFNLKIKYSYNIVGGVFKMKTFHRKL